jgi:hypothetical protein
VTDVSSGVRPPSLDSLYAEHYVTYSELLLRKGSRHFLGPKVSGSNRYHAEETPDPNTGVLLGGTRL